MCETESHINSVQYYYEIILPHTMKLKLLPYICMCIQLTKFYKPKLNNTL